MVLHLEDGDGLLLVRLGAVGDVIRTLPSLVRLREAFPRLRLGWLVEPAAAPLLPGPPWLDRVVVFPRAALGGLWRGPSADRRHRIARFFGELREFRPRVALDFQGTAKSAILARTSGAAWSIGFDRGGAREMSHLLHHLKVTPTSPRLNRVSKNLELLAPLGLSGGPIRFPPPPPPTSNRVASFLQPYRDYRRVAIHPGTSPRQAHKRWPEDRFAAVARGLAAPGVVPILTWGPGEESMRDRILELAGATAVAAPATSLPEMRELLAGCHAFVGGDTGPMHLAWSQGVPVVALFGGTDPEINGPLGEGHRVLAPGWRTGSPPPRRGDGQSLLDISASEVVQAVGDIFRAGPAGATGDGRT